MDSFFREARDLCKNTHSHAHPNPSYKPLTDTEITWFKLPARTARTTLTLCALHNNCLQNQVNLKCSTQLSLILNPKRGSPETQTSASKKTASRRAPSSSLSRPRRRSENRGRTGFSDGRGCFHDYSWGSLWPLACSLQVWFLWNERQAPQHS